MSKHLKRLTAGARWVAAGLLAVSIIVAWFVISLHHIALGAVIFMLALAYGIGVVTE